MIKRIHVNQHIIKANRDKPIEEHEPPLTIKIYNDNIRAHQVLINGPFTLTYRPDKPLSCGARVWIETEADVHAVQHGEQVVKIK